MLYSLTVMANAQRVVGSSTGAGQQADENNGRADSGQKPVVSHSDAILPDDSGGYISNHKSPRVRNSGCPSRSQTPGRIGAFQRRSARRAIKRVE
jgi:hypothetical protein